MRGWCDRIVGFFFVSIGGRMELNIDLRYDVSHFVLAGLYFLLCLLSLFCIVRLCLAGHFKRWQLFFHPIFFLGTLSASPIGKSKYTKINEQTKWQDIGTNLIFFFLEKNIKKPENENNNTGNRIIDEVTSFLPPLFSGPAVRMAFFLVQPFVMEKQIHIPNKVNMLMNSMPSWLFFTDYLIVLFLWYGA